MSESSNAGSQSEHVQQHLARLASRIRRARERQKLTQEELAQRTGISVSFASLLERGERTPSYETLLQIAEALGVTLGDLVDDGSALSVEPHIESLMTFAIDHSLRPEDVEKIIAVASVMFELSPERGGDAKTCARPGCSRAVLARGLCAAHYHQARRAR